MDAVLISISPKWCELIASGKKTIEIRKTRPRKTPFKAYIYETRGFQKVGNDNLNCTVGGNGRGAVIGEFVCEYTQNIYFDSDVRYGIDHPNDYGNWLMEASRVTLWEMHDYFAEKDGVYWNISKLTIYDTPKPLSAFRRPCQNDFWCESCAMWSEHQGCGNAALQVKRPPQSWMYVQEVGD